MISSRWIPARVSPAGDAPTGQRSFSMGGVRVQADRLVIEARSNSSIPWYFAVKLDAEARQELAAALLQTLIQPL